MLGKHVKIAALLILIMGGEAVVVYTLVPKPAVNPGAPGDGDPATTPAEAPAPGDLDTSEVHIGKFNCTNSRASNGVIHLNFDLVAIVSADQELDFAEAISKQHRYSVREAVERVARSSNLEDLEDANFGAIKRLIREEINKVLRKSYVIEIVISDFQMLEQ